MAAGGQARAFLPPLIPATAPSHVTLADTDSPCLQFQLVLSTLARGFHFPLQHKK